MGGRDPQGRREQPPESRRKELENAFESLGSTCATLKLKIVGNPNATQEHERSLELAERPRYEVHYRAIFLSNSEEIEAKSRANAAVGRGYIRDLVNRYFHGDEKVNLRDPRQQDYLADKLRRLMNEKAGLLCFYDETRDQHGGVRPDKVFLALRPKGMTGPVVEAFKKLPGGPKYVNEDGAEGWIDEKTMVVYRAVLNVPRTSSVV